MRRPWIQPLSLTLAAAISALPAFAQRPSTAEVPPTVRAATRLLEVSVVVNDKADRPVEGLTREDFLLWDQGREQEIKVFEAASDRPLPPPAAPLPPFTFTNRLEARAGTPASATVILLDGLNTRFADRAYARQQIAEFLRQLRPDDHVALYALSRGPHILHEFAGDSASLLRALEKYKPPGGPSIDAEPYLEDESTLAGGQFSLWQNELRENLYDAYAPDRALRTLRTLVAISDRLASLPGRKNLVWVSGSFPLHLDRKSFPPPEEMLAERGSLLPEVERAVRALTDAGVAVYPVDARGLLPPGEYSPDRASIGMDSPPLDHATQENMQELAERTGGLAFYNTNDLHTSVRRAVDDARVSYVLGIYPGEERWDGKFHELRVRVTRPGLRARYRRGYFALREEPQSPAYRDAILGAAKWSPLDATQLGMTVRAVPADPAPGPPQIDLTLELDLHSLTLDAQQDRHAGLVDLLLFELSAQNQKVREVSNVVQIALDPQRYEEARMKGAVTVRARVEVAPGASLLRMVVRDVPSGAIGSLSIPLSKVFPAGRL